MRWKLGSSTAATAERLMSRMRRVQEVECNAKRSDHFPIILAELTHACAAVLYYRLSWDTKMHVKNVLHSAGQLVTTVFCV